MIRRERWIENRPAGVGTRETFGHWEGDLLIVGKEAGKADVTSLVERDSRFTFLLANEDKRSTAAVDPADRYCNENCKSCCFGPLSPIRPPRSRLRSSGAAGWSRARLPR